MYCGYHIWSKEQLMRAKNDDDLHGGQSQQRLSIENYAPWLPNLVRRTADASLG